MGRLWQPPIPLIGWGAPSALPLTTDWLQWLLVIQPMPHHWFSWEGCLSCGSAPHHQLVERQSHITCIPRSQSVVKCGSSSHLAGSPSSRQTPMPSEDCWLPLGRQQFLFGKFFPVDFMGIAWFHAGFCKISEITYLWVITYFTFLRIHHLPIKGNCQSRYRHQVILYFQAKVPGVLSSQLCAQCLQLQDATLQKEHWSTTIKEWHFI